MLAGQAGMEATGWLKVVGLVQKDVRSEMFAGWRREKSNNDRKVWRSVKNQAGREFAGEIRHIGYIKKIRKETKICLVRFVVMVFQLLMEMR